MNEGYPVSDHNYYGLTENNFKRVVLVINPNTSEQELVDLHKAELEGSVFSDRLFPIYTTPDTQADHELLMSTLASGDVVVTLGGDGTATRLLEPLLSKELIDLGIPLLPANCGNSNDLPKMANNLRRTSLSEVLRFGSLVSVNPINVSIMSGDEYTVLAANYVGFGNTAILCDRFNDQEHRGNPDYKKTLKRLRMEGKIVRKQLADLEEFKIKDESGERVVNEITVTNGSRMAKFGRFELSLTAPNLFKVTLENGSKLKTVAWMGRLATSRLPGEYIPQDSQYDFLLKTPTHMHADAEVTLLPADTFVSISRDERSFTLLSTLL